MRAESQADTIAEQQRKAQSSHDVQVHVLCSASFAI